MPTPRQYKVRFITAFTLNTVVKRLNQDGSDGWHLAAIAYVPEGDLLMVMERELPEDEDNREELTEWETLAERSGEEDAGNKE